MFTNFFLILQGSGGDDEDYLYDDDDDISLGAGGAGGGKTGIFQPADNKGSSIGSTDSFNQQHGGLDSSKFNFVRPGKDAFYLMS